MKAKFSLFHLIFFFAFLLSGYTEPNFKAILKEIDNMNNFKESDFSATYTIVSEKPGEQTSVMKIQMFRRDREDKFLMLILQPEVQKGQGYLRIEDNVWFYDPESRKFSHSSLKENIQDSEAKNSDFKVSSLSEDYDVTSWQEDKLGRYDVYVVELEAKHSEVSYPKLKLWIRKDMNQVLKVENYSLSGRLMRTALYPPSYIKLGNRYLPSKMLFIDELREGEKSQVTLTDASLSSLPDYVFTKSYLERVSR
ncbi:MAG: outer membrane lipoprotein-sorting protein [Spirochaetes bacterium]|nr:MAG: outer membrane lipoprotein-sorting protein [Spirochaetota bacterium]